MILTSGQLVVKENKNKTAKFFGEVEVGDIVEVKANLNKTLTKRVSKFVTVFNHTKGTERTDAPTHISAGMDKMKFENNDPFSFGYAQGYEDGYDVAKRESGDISIEEALTGTSVEEIRFAIFD
ncbi:hypothetical protein ACIQ1D_18895 [Lysinibacillus xylanilyticus]|uniref:hypothetical protein n=1 Tax=Lysinibacillus xylanilyticus TaxID=582475 RepID=UPI0038117D36